MQAVSDSGRRRRWVPGRPAAFLALLALFCACGPALAPALPGRAPVPASPWPGTYSVLSLNAFMLPGPWIASDQSQRAQLLIEYLSGYDAIVFQELFDDSARSLLLGGLAREYPYATRMVGVRNGLFRADGGIIIVSRWPIEVEAQLTFGAVCGGADCLADKGVVYTRILKGSRRYHLFGTHTQSAAAAGAPELRAEQFRMIRAFIEAQAVPADEVVLLAGDLNVDCRSGDEFTSMLAILGASEVQPCGNRSTWNGPDNDIAPGRVRVYIDYILLSRHHLTPIRSWSEVVPLRSPDYPLGDLSDHWAVAARFLFAP